MHLPASDFAAIQDDLGLDNSEMSARLFRGPDRSDLIGCYRSGSIAIPAVVALAVVGMARRVDSPAMAA